MLNHQLPIIKDSVQRKQCTFLIKESWQNDLEFHTSQALGKVMFVSRKDNISIAGSSGYGACFYVVNYVSKLSLMVSSSLLVLT